jgi:hypothetical protein
LKSIRLFFRKFEFSPLTLALMIVTLGLLRPVPAGAAETLDQSQILSQSPTTVSASVLHLHRRWLYLYLTRYAIVDVTCPPGQH